MGNKCEKAIKSFTLIANNLNNFPYGLVRSAVGY